MVEMRLSDRTVLRAHAVSDSRPLQNQRTTWRLDVFAVNYGAAFHRTVQRQFNQ